MTLITPGGDPLANKTVTVRGGVYKNGGYCQTALLGSRAGALVSGITGDTYTTDAAGNITVYLDSTQFWSAEKGESNTTALSLWISWSTFWRSAQLTATSTIRCC